MAENPLRRLGELGQSVWLDNLSRRLLDSGELKRWIVEDGITGITSNPTIFQKAITGSSDYDPSLQELLRRGMRDEKELFFALAVEDISRAAELLRPVYERSSGKDGFVSLEVSPDLAYDAEGTIAEAKRLFARIGRKNILIKVPGTRACLPAIEELTAQGVNVNVTLLFSIRRYEEVTEAYLRGLEGRIGNGLPVNEIASVASFFVSRVDTRVDQLLAGRLEAAPPGDGKRRIESLQGKAAVANARLAYRRHRAVFSGEKFRENSGAGVQRILWASTGTKNPRYSDIQYVQELIGPGSINTLPEVTLAAFKDHGQVKITIEDQLAEAEGLFPALAKLGIDMDQVTEELEEEGVKLFSDSFSSLLKEIAAKRDALLTEKNS